VSLLCMTVRLAISFYSPEEGNFYFRIVVLCYIVTVKKVQIDVSVWCSRAA
jgi:hypothetical protein